MLPGRAGRETLRRVTGRIRTAVRVEGIVQGVGFRPFVYSLATGLGLGGLVGNDVDGVFAEVEGDSAAVARFLVLLEQQAPAAGPHRAGHDRATCGRPGRRSSPSRPALRPAGRAGAPPDAGLGRHRDLRRLPGRAGRSRPTAGIGYPFINCTNCGPRFTIVRDVPYDRPLTTMSGFAMCAACAAEYHDPADRRFHAQPVVLPGLRPAAVPGGRGR